MLVEGEVGRRSQMQTHLRHASGDPVLAPVVERDRHERSDPGFARDVHKENTHELQDGNMIIDSAVVPVIREVVSMPVSLAIGLSRTSS